MASGLNQSVGRLPATTHVGFGTLPGMDPALVERSLELFAHEVAPRLH